MLSESVPDFAVYLYNGYFYLSYTINSVSLRKAASFLGSMQYIISVLMWYAKHHNSFNLIKERCFKSQRLTNASLTPNIIPTELVVECFPQHYMLSNVFLQGMFKMVSYSPCCGIYCQTPLRLESPNST